MSTLNTITDYIDAAIYRPGGHLIFIAITSAAQGKIKSESLPFGEGKSSLAMGISKRVYKGDEEKVKENMGYDEFDIQEMLRKPRRTHCYISEDMQIAFGKHKSHDSGIKALAGLISAARPYIAIFVGTMPHLGTVAKAWRELFMFEIKVPFRGYYEVQQIKHYSPFDDPYNPRPRLDYKGEAEFPKPTDELEAWYVEWRDQRFKEQMERVYGNYFKRQEDLPEPPPEDEVSISAQIIRASQEGDTLEITPEIKTQASRNMAFARHHA